MPPGTALGVGKQTAHLPCGSFSSRSRQQRKVKGVTYVSDVKCCRGKERKSGVGGELCFLTEWSRKALPSW